MKAIYGLSCALLAAAAITAAPALAAGSDTITIGFTDSQTGALNVDSKGQTRGYDLWRDQVNAKGGIKVGSKHYKVNFVSYDDQSVGGRVQQLYTRLINHDKAQFLFSPYSSGMTAPATVVTEEYGKIMLDSGGAEEKPFQQGNKDLFMVITSAGHYLSGALAALKEKDPHAKVAIVYSDDPFSKAVATAAIKQAKDAGLDVVINTSYDPSTTDFGPIVNKIVSSGADAFLGGGHYADGATLARQMHEQKANMKFMSILVAPSDNKFATLGAAALGVTFPSQWEPQVAYKPQFGPTVPEFIKAFEDKYHMGVPDYHAASGYAVGLILQHAIETAGSLDTKKVAAALNAMNVTTFYGPMKVTTDAKNHGLQVGHSMVLGQWQKDKNGKLIKQIVFPANAASAKMLYPIPATN